MVGSISGIFLVAVFGAVAVCCGVLIARLYRAVSPGRDGERGTARAEPGAEPDPR